MITILESQVASRKCNRPSSKTISGGGLEESKILEDGLSS